tara:strand:- start:248 stop:457 length:210 start_codon:yes stop_codon:yes gene_type:complete
MYGWYSEKVSKEIGKVYLYRDKYGSNVLCTLITEKNICPYEEETNFGSDVISIGEVKEYVKTFELNVYE